MPFQDRQKQYAESDIPAAWRTHVANGIRKKFASEFDLDGLSDQEVIQRHHSRFGADMTPDAYGKKLDEAYGKGFTPPPAPTETLGERAQDVVTSGKAIAQGLVPFVIPEVGKAAVLRAGARAVATKIPVASQIGFLGGHAINEAVDVATAKALENTAASLPFPDTQTRTQEYYAKLHGGLSARGYSDEQIMQEARGRARNVASGYQQTVESIDKDVNAAQQAALVEPARAATDAFFLGVGAPQIEGALQKGLAKIGLMKAVGAAAKPASMIGTIASHVKTGVVVGAPGIGIQGAISAGVQAAADNKTPQEVGQALVKGGLEGVKEGALGGAIIGGAAGVLETGLGAAVKPLVARRVAREFAESQEQKALDDARLRRWREYDEHQRATVARTEELQRADVARAADNFDPHTTPFPTDGEPADVATSIIQKKFGDDVAMSEIGLRAASKIEERLRLHQDANADIDKFQQRGLPAQPPAAAAPEITGAQLPAQPEGPAVLGPNLGPIEKGGRPEQPMPLEPNPKLTEPAPPAAAAVAEPSTEAPIPAPAPVPRPSEQAIEFKESAAAPFRASAKKALENIPRASGSLTVHPLSYYTKPGVEMYLSPDGKTGYALVPRAEGGKELVSAFNMGERGLGLSAVREAVARGATHLDALKPLEPLYEKAGFITTRVEKNYAPGQPDVVYMEIPGAVSSAQAAINKTPVSQHVTLSEGPGGEITLERVGTPPGKDLADAISAATKSADEKQVPVVTRLAPVPGPRGGTIPVEKLLPWYEQHGFKLVDSTKLPEGQMATATLRREPKAFAAKKAGMLEAQQKLFDRLKEMPITGKQRGEIVKHTKDLTRGEADVLIDKLRSGEIK